MTDYATTTPLKLLRHAMSFDANRTKLAEMLAEQAATHIAYAELTDSTQAKALATACIDARDLVRRAEPVKINSQVRLLSPVMIELFKLLDTPREYRPQIMDRWNAKEGRPRTTEDEFINWFDGNVVCDGTRPYDYPVVEAAFKAGWNAALKVKWSNPE